MMKSKTLTLALVFLVVLGTPMTVWCGEIQDNPGEHWQTLMELEVIRGWGGSLHPQRHLTRAQLSALLVRSRGLSEAAELARNTSAYSDVPPNHWAAGYITVARNLGANLAGGSAGFGPEEPVSAGELLKSLALILGYVQCLEEGKEAISPRWRDKMWISGGKEDPHLLATREEAARVLARVLTSVPRRQGGYLADQLYTWGDPSSVRVEVSPQELVTGGHQALIEARVVDSAGRTVRDWEGSLVLSLHPWVLEVLEEDVQSTYQGQASWRARSLDLWEAEIGVEVSDGAWELERGRATIPLAAQRPTSITLEPDLEQVSADGKTRAGFTAGLWDQAGGPMSGRGEEITFSFTGPGLWASGSEASEKTVEVLEGKARVEIVPRFNQPGEILVKAWSEALGQEAASQVRTVIPLPPSQLSLEILNPEDLLGDGTPAALELRLLDAEGNLVTHPAFGVGGEFGPEKISLGYSSSREVLGPVALTSTYRGKARFHVSQEGKGEMRLRASAPGFDTQEVRLSFAPGHVFSARFTDPLPLAEDPTVPYQLPAEENRVRLVLELVDRAGNPAPGEGYGVEWWVSSGMGLLTGQQEATCPAGRAETELVVGWPQDWGARVGARVIRPDGTLLTEVFSPSYQALEGDLASRVEVDFQLEGPGGTRPGEVSSGEALIARALVRDREGNPRPGAWVTFSLKTPETLGLLPGESLTAVTDDMGEARLVLQTEGSGPAVLKARIPNIPGQPRAFASTMVRSGDPFRLGLADLPRTFEEGEIYRLAVEVRDAGGNQVILAQPMDLRISLVQGWDSGLSLRSSPAGISRRYLDLRIPRGQSQAHFWAVVDDGEGAGALTLACLQRPELSPEPYSLMGPGLSGGVNLLSGDQSGSLSALLQTADAGDRILAYPGIYPEEVEIWTPGVSLEALEAGSAEIQGGLRIHGPESRVKGFRVAPVTPDTAVSVMASGVELRDLVVEGIFTGPALQAGTALEPVSGFRLEGSRVSALLMGLSDRGIVAHLGTGEESRIRGNEILVHEGLVDFSGVKVSGEGARYCLCQNLIQLERAMRSGTGLDLAVGPGGQALVRENEITGHTLMGRWPQEDDHGIDHDLPEGQVQRD